MKTPELTEAEQKQREEAARKAAEQDQREEARSAVDQQERPGGEVRNSGRFRLMSPHIIDGKTLPTGTEVGDGTEHPFNALPSNQMMGLDDESRRKVNEIHQKLYGRDAPWHAEYQQALEEDRRLQDEQRQAEREAEPVSHAQAYEQGKEWQGKPPGPPPGPAPSPTIGGDKSVSMGPATPDIQEENIRPHLPLNEQLPRAKS